MAHVTVAVPGPWWTLLSYNAGQMLPDGIRVKVPLGRSYRVGVTTTDERPADDGVALKDIAEVLDEAPALPPELWQSIVWFGKNWFVGTGMACKAFLPAKFLDGEPLETVLWQPQGAGRETNVRYIYDPLDETRYAKYLSMLSDGCDGNLVLFPEVAAAKKFWNTLPQELKEQGALWPMTNPAKQWALWQKVRSREVRFVVGTPGASSLPMPDIRRIVVEDESSVAWKSQKHPDFHRRSFLAVRARNACAEFVLGGRMPSSKVYEQDENDPNANAGLEKRSIFVNMWDAKGFNTESIKERVPISAPLLRETKRTLQRDEWALWILDRKGYAGEIYCDECGAPVFCTKCGSVMRWEGRNQLLRCGVCRATDKIPESCPSCKSQFLEGHRPGIEAIWEKACHLLQNAGPVVLFEDKMKVGELKKQYISGGLVIGTRRVLALADDLHVGLVGWIDADGEARSPEYDSKVRAFGLVWESAWRGNHAESREIVLQSRKPGKDWQMGVKLGWGTFWRNELKERKMLELPPCMPLLKIAVPKGKGAGLEETLLEKDFQCWRPDDKADEVWVKTRRFNELRKALEPYFHIRNTRIGMPAVTLYPD